ncbi:immune inhibitor A [Flavobacteriaceae bacterium TK19130]|nr:immune inhibitor A [Thermobacterium salinum]
MKRLLCLLLLIATTSLLAQNVQQKYQRAKISYTSAADLATLESLGVPVEHGMHKRGHFLISDFSVSELETAQQAGFQVEVLIADSKAHFLQQNRNPTPFRNPSCDTSEETYATPDNFELGSMGGYLTYQEVLDELDEMKAAYPNLITTRANIHDFLTEGQPDNSVTPSIGGNGIQWVKISDNPDSDSEGEQQILYTAIHHAREPISLSQLVFYMWYLLENYDSNPEIQGIVDNTELYFVPVVNPDGYLYNEKTDPNGGGFWRKNRKNGNGVDNNRNYDYYINGNPSNNTWGGEGASGNPNAETYHGPAPFSEVENQAIKWFVENHDFVMALNNHTFGDLLLYPYGYAENETTAENDLFVGISSELVSRNSMNNILSSELYPAAGDSDDFMYGTVNTHDKIYAMTPEIGPEFWPPSNQIIPLSKSMMYFNLTAAKMVNNYLKVEDTAPTFVGDEASINTTFDVQRLGVSGSGSFTVSLDPVSSNIASVGSPVNYNSLAVLEEGDGIIQYTLAGGTQAGDDIVFDLVVDNGSFESRTRVNKKFGALTAIFEDAGDSTSDNFNNNGWGTTTSTFVSASSSITDSPSGNYPNNANETITLSDAVDLTDAIGANVSFFAKWEIENNWDYVQFEVSIDNGASWIPQCGNYSNEGSTNNGQPTGEPLYDGFQTEWVLEEIDLSDYLGETILVRFQLRSDNFEREDGFYFDDLKINVVEESTLDASEVAENSFSLYPNPTKGILNINTQTSEYSMTIFNVQGQLVQEEKSLSGSNSIDVSNLASGLYLVRLTGETNSQTFKVLKQ